MGQAKGGFRNVINGCEQTGSCLNSSPQLWGQYSPFFSVPSEIDPSIPSGCEVTFVNVLSRHGARDPTARKSALYADVVSRIHDAVTTYGVGFEWLGGYEYTLGADQLTFFGQQQLVDLGSTFYERYESLAGEYEPFIRAAGSERVIESAKNFTQGLYENLEREAEDAIEEILIIPETDGFNNTLNHGTCTEFEEGAPGDLGTKKQNIWKEIWVPPIQKRLNEKLPGVNFTLEETIYMMDLCPFETVANDNAEISQFCALFSLDEWRKYDYFETLDKWYGYGHGNPLGAAQGVGFANELISRMTGEPVEDSTTTNSTLDGSEKTFPLSKKLYADFSHDNTMSSIYAALGLYRTTPNLPVDHRIPPEKAGGYSSSWTVPFAGRMFVEKMTCAAAGDDGEELVRILINDRVSPLPNCRADSLGRCRLSEWIESLSFVREGGNWDECFT